MGTLNVTLPPGITSISFSPSRPSLSTVNRFPVLELPDTYYRCQWRLCAIGIYGCARGKIQMQPFDFLLEDGFRETDRTIRDGLGQTAACEQTTGNKRQRLPAGYCCHSKIRTFIGQ